MHEDAMDISLYMHEEKWTCGEEKETLHQANR